MPSSSGAIDKYTRRLERGRALSEGRVRAVKHRDGRDLEVETRFRLSGSEVMEGPLQLVDTNRPTLTHHAVPAKYLEDRLEGLRESVHDAEAQANQAMKDAQEFKDYVDRVLR